MDTMMLVFPPTADWGMRAVMALQTVAAYSTFASEKSGTTEGNGFGGYSKFYKPQEKGTITVPSRVGMAIIYLPACLFSLWSLFSPSTLSQPESPNMPLVQGLVAFHFGKRCLEVLLLHKYSGNTDLITSFGIGTVYTINAWFIIWAHSKVPPEAAASSVLLTPGLVLSAVGQVGNLYHHILLARLRKSPAPRSGAAGDKASDKAREYVMPTGGMFGLVAAPHYLFELISWLGMAMVVQHAGAFTLFAQMTGYLGGRAKRQLEWNQSKFPNYPTSTRALVPGLF
ncbi:3-oxo-5-alpha-steroid 4-dehydrogenase-domain-containing protein [Baffinella frigidus]|nr:3-oxo-5-alpha-steroid 4-dehydrogenase-domain-containing protein [Cryptophyta sp. CCMP2293]